MKLIPPDDEDSCNGGCCLHSGGLTSRWLGRRMAALTRVLARLTPCIAALVCATIFLSPEPLKARSVLPGLLVGAFLVPIAFVLFVIYIRLFHDLIYRRVYRRGLNDGLRKGYHYGLKEGLMEGMKYEPELRRENPDPAVRRQALTTFFKWVVWRKAA